MVTPAALTCPRCAAPRASGPECPRCGVVYRKAELAALRMPEPAPAPELLPPFEPAPTQAEAGSLVLNAAALPVALAAAWLVGQSSMLRFMRHTFVAMWLHELGHASTGWLCGVAAVPGPWRTSIPEERSVVAELLFAAAFVALARFGWRTRQRALLGAGATLLALQAVGTFLLPLHSAQAWITFGGDGGALVLGALLMAAFYLRLEGAPNWNELRFGLLVLGALAFADVFSLWWSARTDADAIPFGEIEGVGLSDPSKLTEVYNWSTTEMVHRYLALGGACLAGLALLYVLGLVRSREE